MKSLEIYSDGGSRGNPGPAAAAFFVFEEGRELHSEGLYLEVSTNNIAEYTGLLMAIEWICDNKKGEYQVLNFHLDSELVVKQMKGEYKIKNPNMLTLAKKVKEIERKLNAEINYIHVPRKDNKDADLLVNQTLDAHQL